MEPIAHLGGATNPQAAIRPPQSGEEGRLRRAAQEFEGLFLGMLLKAMRTTVGRGGLFREGPDTQLYREMFDEEVGRAMARAGGIGLAGLLMGGEKTPQAPAAGNR